MLIFLRFWFRGIFASSSDSAVRLHSQPVHHRQKVNHWKCLFGLGPAGRSRRDAICTQPKTKGLSEAHTHGKILLKINWISHHNILLRCNSNYFLHGSINWLIFFNWRINILSKKKIKKKVKSVPKTQSHSVYNYIWQGKAANHHISELRSSNYRHIFSLKIIETINQLIE